MTDQTIAAIFGGVAGLLTGVTALVVALKRKSARKKAAASKSENQTPKSPE